MGYTHIGDFNSKNKFNWKGIFLKAKFPKWACKGRTAATHVPLPGWVGFLENEHL